MRESEPEYSYVKLELKSEDLDSEERRLLEAVGVECLDQGGSHEAYGIIPMNATLVEILRKLPGIKEVQLEGPPTGK